MNWRVVAALALIIAALTIADRFLAATEASEVRSAARHSYLAGSRLWSQGKPDAALDSLRNAHALERENPEYELQLIGVLLSANKMNEADPLIEEMLQRKPNDGRTNLMAGRLALKEGDLDGAKAYYHRAVFGDWPRDDRARRMDARLELIRLLVSEHANQQLLSELISFEADGVSDPAIQEQVAHWYLLAGSPARSAAAYRELTARDPAAWSGLGEAELELGDYRAARAAFGHTADSQRLALVSLLAGLDPTVRRLPSSEKYERSRRILGMAKADLEQRAPNAPELQDAAAVLSKKTPRNVSNESAELVLTLAEQIWKKRLTLASPQTPDEETLRLIFEKISR